jgi:drug/metabolite transporter superfamily protein YnfA
MTTAKPVSYYLAPALLLIAAVLAVWNWYLSPERAASWVAALVTLAVMALILWVFTRAAGRDRANHVRHGVGHGIVFAALILAVSLSLRLAAALGASDDRELRQRLTMVILGAFFVFIGNAMPKMLTPLSALGCDGARTSALQRLMGWTWVLTGLGFIVPWLVLPADIAQPVSVAILLGGGLTIMTRVVRLWRASRKASGLT